MSTAHAPEDFAASPWKALWSLMVGFFMMMLDATIVSIATPALMRAFDATLTTVVWVTSAYLLTFAVPLLITGRLGDRFGPKRLYLAGLAVFTAASLWCGLTASIGGLIAARAVQGLGAALLAPQTMAIITRTFPPERRGQATALYGATAGVASLVGPVLGGLLIDTVGWEWIFFLNVPLGVLAFALVWRHVPLLPTHAHTFDVLGVVLSGIGLFCLVFGLQEAEAYDWGTISGVVSVPLLLAAGVLFLGLFVAWQARMSGDPLVPLRLFRDRNFSLANVAVTAMASAVVAMAFPFTLYAQTVRGLSPAAAALLMAPQAVVTILLARPAGRLVDTVPPRLLAGVGLAIMAGTVLALSLFMRPGTPVWAILLVAALQGVGASTVWGPLSAAATRNLPPQLAGAGAGVYTTTQQVGSVLGSAAIASLMASRLAAHLPPAPGGAHAEAGAVVGGRLPDGLLAPFSSALADAMLLPAGILAVGVVAALFLQTPAYMRAARAR